MTDQLGLYRFKLAQKRYESGAFYWSAIMDRSQASVFDGRFIVEGGDSLTPTKNGFRIPAEKIDCFKRAIAGDLRELKDTVIVENKSFRLHVRYVNDKYGEGIDIRKYRTTDSYQGWDKSGIRMKLEDVATLRDWLNQFQVKDIPLARNLFAGKNFGGKHQGSNGKHSVPDNTINPALNALLEI